MEAYKYRWLYMDINLDIDTLLVLFLWRTLANTVTTVSGIVNTLYIWNFLFWKISWEVEKVVQRMPLYDTFQPVFPVITSYVIIVQYQSKNFDIGQCVYIILGFLSRADHVITTIIKI